MIGAKRPCGASLTGQMKTNCADPQKRGGFLTVYLHFPEHKSGALMGVGDRVDVTFDAVRAPQMQNAPNDMDMLLALVAQGRYETGAHMSVPVPDLCLSGLTFP